jgi:hypothetical protein
VPISHQAPLGNPRASTAATAPKATYHKWLARSRPTITTLITPIGDQRMTLLSLYAGAMVPMTQTSLQSQAGLHITPPRHI